VSDDKNTVTAMVHVAAMSFDEVQAMATYLKKACALPAALQNRDADVAMVIMTGHELGLAPMAAIRAIHIVEGRPYLSADAMQAIVIRSGKAKYFRCVETTAQRATYETFRVGEPEPMRYSFSLDDAAQAKLLNRGKTPGFDNWSKHPKAMLRARASSILARMVYPDVLMGVYTNEEDEEIRGGTVAASSRFEAPTQPEAVVDAELVDEPGVAQDTRVDELRKLIHAASTTPELESLMTQILALPEEQRAELRQPYQDKRFDLREQDL
jgi:hypothetical protein